MQQKGGKKQNFQEFLRKFFYSILRTNVYLGNISLNLSFRNPLPKRFTFLKIEIFRGDIGFHYKFSTKLSLLNP